jgi:hypothetical protein
MLEFAKKEDSMASTKGGYDYVPEFAVSSIREVCITTLWLSLDVHCCNGSDIDLGALWPAFWLQ